jgi:protein-disulfide isomerase
MSQENKNKERVSRITLLSISLIVSALIVSGSIFFVGEEISSKLSALSSLALTTQPATIEKENTNKKNETIETSSKPTDSTPKQEQPQPSTGIKTVDLMDDDPVKGLDDAPIVIIEFSDFQCPFCGRFYSQTLPQIKKEFIDTGKAQFVYRDFPISSIHSQAKPAALAAECANEQGKFWEYHNKIFENQSNLSEENLKKWAKEIGLNMTTFKSCFDSKKYDSEVNKDFSDGQNAGVSGTPTFFIGKRNEEPQKIVGAQGFNVFKQAIDSLLQ